MINFADESAGASFSDPSDASERIPFHDEKMSEELEGLTGPQGVAYLCLLAVCHQLGSIPNDPKMLWVIYGRKFDEGDIKAVLARMVPDPDNPGRLLHPHYVLWKNDGAPDGGEA